MKTPEYYEQKVYLGFLLKNRYAKNPVTGQYSIVWDVCNLHGDVVKPGFAAISVARRWIEVKNSLLIDTVIGE